MRITPINFAGIYKTDKNTVSSINTAQFIERNMFYKEKNLCITTSTSDNYTTYYILTKDDDKLEKELENCIKRDCGKYWKAEPLQKLWINKNIAEQIFKTEKTLNSGKENWVDYTKNKPEYTENIPF